MSFYAASKKSNEIMAYSYSSIHRLPCTGLRFFSVYGPWGRPDMAAYLFTKKLFENKTLDLFNFGRMERDFTFVDDIVNGIIPLIKFKKKKENLHTVYNLGNNKPETLLRLVSLLEMFTERKAKINKKRMQLGDVRHTYANIKESKKDLKFKPKTSLKEGLEKFVNWYKEYHKIN